ncbi:MAG: alpha/beta hydrolase [Oligoflexia bacterium]|nr:alpha/beta hydrolase [Oligoflexia bacterium]
MNVIKKTTGYAKSYDSTPIFYEVRGEGKPLIFCYGICCLMNHWHNQVRFFSNQYQVIMIDYRGHHQSPIPESRDNLSVDACVEDIHAVTKHLGIKKATYIGHSWGSQLLVRFFDLYPEWVSNLIMVNGFVANPISGMFGSNLPRAGFELMKQWYEELPETTSYLWRTLAYNAITLKLSQLLGGFNPQLTKVKDIEVYLKGVASINIEVFIKLFESMMNYDGRGVLEKINVPTLIITGEKDIITPIKHQEEINKKIKSSEITKVPFGSHCSMLDMPEFVNLRIEKFLKDHNYN